jgi:hypothetical protein
VLLFYATAFAQPIAGYTTIHPDKMEYKNFYFVSLLGHFDEVKDILCNDRELFAAAKQKMNTLRASNNHMDMLQSLRFTDTEINDIGNRLKELYQPDNALGKIMSNHVIPSGCYYKYQEMPVRDLLMKAWEQDVRGINHVIDIYGEGQKPRYPLIDSISFVRNSPIHQNMIEESVRYLLESQQENQLFFALSLRSASLFLHINDRNEATDFEPMSETVNKNSYDYISSVDWDKYPYSVILLLGSGPDDYKTTLNPGIKPRLKMIAHKYHQGVAPLIAVSGGRVHPYKTPNNEAFFMKKYLVEECGVPEWAILMEPHARHTTTNVRNTVRIMFRQGVPMHKCALISSSERHVSSVASPAFAERCQREMGVKPYELGKRISEQFVEFYPQVIALQINPVDDPLDP